MTHVANDYAIRDYLENYYRPNLRVKNRDTCTVLGPWLVDAADVPNPHDLALRTFVNGSVTQQGNTSNMISHIPALIEYLSSFMTLSAGDVILTGTPDGVVNVNVGDQVVTEIDGIGRLRMGRGRSEAVQQGVGNALMAVARAHFDPLMAAMHLGVTLQIDVGAEVFDAKHSTLHPLFNKPD